MFVEGDSSPYCETSSRLDTPYQMDKVFTSEFRPGSYNVVSLRFFFFEIIEKAYLQSIFLHFGFFRVCFIVVDLKLQGRDATHLVMGEEEESRYALDGMGTRALSDLLRWVRFLSPRYQCIGNSNCFTVLG